MNVFSKQSQLDIFGDKLIYNQDKTVCCDEKQFKENEEIW